MEAALQNLEAWCQAERARLRRYAPVSTFGRISGGGRPS